MSRRAAAASVHSVLSKGVLPVNAEAVAPAPPAPPVDHEVELGVIVAHSQDAIDDG